MTRETIAERQVRLEEQIKALVAAIATLVDQGKEAAESRRRGYQAQEETRIEIINMKHRLDGLERSVEGIKPTTVELERVRDRVIFAGRLGQGLWTIGKMILAAAAGAASAWYAMTGRPPP
ncbi:hypothetical protein [Aquamicrobium terrae]|uniref:DUF1515 domain-containing protein n=1 Tax=Aquamicrobium terrae TaxID=1324945 RepID=A0ABV2MV15_9HYPH